MCFGKETSMCHHNCYPMYKKTCRRPLCQEKIEAAWKNKVERGADYNRIIQVDTLLKAPT